MEFHFPSKNLAGLFGLTVAEAGLRGNEYNNGA
jgi:hypothetical protein